MAICKYVGGGITGAIGKSGLGLGSALGLFGAVDLGTRVYTGYGLLEMLNVPYIECPDGSYASAIEWYGSGLKCPKKPEPAIAQLPSTQKSSDKIGEEYAEQVERLGGSVFPYFAYHWWWFNADNDSNADDGIVRYSPGFYDPQLKQTDKYGNSLAEAKNLSGRGDSQVYWGIQENGRRIYQEGFGGWSGSATPNGLTYRDIRQLGSSPNLMYKGFKTMGAVLIGTRISLPSLPFAPPAVNIPPLSPFTPTPPPPKEDCEMACPCLTRKDIEDAVKKALGLKAFAPEKLIRELGAKMFVAPGPSLVPVVPKDLVEAIAALVAANYMRAGYGRYPVLMPSSLINDNSIVDAVPAEPIENFAEWFEWSIKQQDAVQGEWPVEIAIVDGAKRQPLKFENISEAFVELSGLMIQTATDADAAVSVASHAAVAATKATTAAVIAQKNAECLIKFFGVRTGFGSIFVDSVITPMDSDSPNFNLKKFLTPSKQSVAFYTDDDPFDFQAVLDRILRNSEIAKSAIAMDASKEIVGDYARNQRKYDEAETKREAEKELDKLQASINAKNPDFRVKIRVDTLAPSGDVTGSNFVIKRPKPTNE